MSIVFCETFRHVSGGCAYLDSPARSLGEMGEQHFQHQPRRQPRPFGVAFPGSMSNHSAPVAYLFRSRRPCDLHALLF